MNVNKKIAKKVLAGSIAVMMTAGAVGAYNYNYNREIAHVQAAQEQDAKDLTKVAENVLSDAKSGETTDGISKEESVYVKADATGKATKTTITEWLKNAQTGTIEDTSDLKDIKNIKGDEEFTQNSDGSLSWKSEGSDIYYQGTSDKELPVSVNIAYKLDGKSISAEELKGKSGKVEIQFTYDNKSKQTVEVNGKKEEMYTPFTMVSAMMLSSDNYSNVSVENGKLISDGERQIIVGVAFPGLAENLNLKDTDLDIDIPETVTITADVKDASVGSTITLASTELMNEFNLDNVDSFDDLDKSIGDLKDATNQLVDGSKAAADGAKQLADGANTFSDGAGTLADGSKTLSDGVNTLNTKSGDLISGVNKLATGVGEYTGGVEALANGSAKLEAGVGRLAAGAQSLKAGIAQAKAGADALVSGVNTAKESADKLATGAAGVQAGIGQVSGSLGTAADALNAISAENLLDSVNVEVSGGSATITDVQVDALMSQFSELDEATQEAIRAAIKQGVEESSVAVSDADVNKSLSQTGQVVLGTTSKVKAGVQTAQATLTDTENSQLAQGIAAVSNGTSQLAGALGMGDGTTQTIGLGAATLAGALGEGDGTTQTIGLGAKALVDGIGTAENSETVLGGITALSAGASKLQENSAPLNAGLKDLADGGTKLVSGVSELADGATKLSSGATELSDGSKTLAEGAGTLADGNQTLADGMLKYKEEAIDKLVNLFDGDISNVTDRIDAMATMAKNYKSFAGIKDGMAGSTKFIIETEGVDD